MRVLIFTIILVLFGATSTAAQHLGVNNDPDSIIDAVVSTGTGNISEAWLIDPTDRYPHFVRGQSYEPSGLRVRLANGQILTLQLETEFVFEDRTARLGDMDADGQDEIIVVLSSQQKGSALAIYSVEQGQIVLKARTPFIGRPFRWLNPAGIADYNGDGQLDIALVQKPHLSKQLEIWTFEGRALKRLARVDNVSNHHNGSPETGLSASADFDKNGTTDLAILSGDYSSVRLFRFESSGLKEFARFPLPALGVRNFILRSGKLLVPLQTGENFELNF